MESKRTTKIQIICLCLGVLIIACQNPKPSNTSSYSKSILTIREQKIFQFQDSKLSPVLNLNDFKGLNFYPVSKEYRVFGEISKLKGNREVLLQTSSNKQKRFLEFAEISFQLEGQELSLIAFKESGKPKELFIPFKDYTNEKETYKGGRYLNAQLIEGNKVLLDFNLCYQPYCLYNPEYVCPLPPKENTLEVSIEAGEKL